MGTTIAAIQSRRREVAIRSSLGASLRSLSAMFVRETAYASLIGVLLGAAFSVVAGSMLSARAVELRSATATEYVLGSLCCWLVCVCAAVIGCLGLARSQPSELLRRC
jgi:ABC-type antimicrobial peptide transport system permease subunit